MRIEQTATATVGSVNSLSVGTFEYKFQETVVSPASGVVSKVKPIPKEPAFHKKIRLLPLLKATPSANR
jgi:hypothetical protein